MPASAGAGVGTVNPAIARDAAVMPATVLRRAE